MCSLSPAARVCAHRHHRALFTEAEPSVRFAFLNLLGESRRPTSGGASAFKEAAVATLEFELQVQLYIQNFFCGENYCLFQYGMRW